LIDAVPRERYSFVAVGLRATGLRRRFLAPKPVAIMVTGSSANKFENLEASDRRVGGRRYKFGLN
jgi:hypothetical protein